MDKIVLDGILYELIENNGDAFNPEDIKERYTDYFHDFDYILGDYAYNKLRLKGFCEKHNPRYNKIDDFSTKNKYVEELCAYKCRYFVLKRVKKSWKIRILW